MAEATLSNVTKALADSNRDQVKAQKDTTAAVASLTKSMKAFLEQAELDRKRQLEADIEARRAASRASASSSSSSSGGGGGSGFDFSGVPGAALLGTVGAVIGTITASLSGFIAATEGLGPNMKDLKRFKGAFTGYTGFLKTTMAAFKLPKWAKPTGKPPVSMFDDVAKNIKTIEDLVKGRFTFDEKSDRWKDLDTKNKGYTKLGNVEKYVDDLLKNLAKVEDALPNNAANLAANAELTAGIGKEGYISKAMQALKNNKWLNTFLKVLRPIAVILSVFDGVENAQTEMEDREGKMDKWIGGGLGGFLSGAVSSFFGEMLDFIKAIPGYIIKQFVPAGWLNEDGTFKEDENLFTSFMGKWENFSFTQVIKDIIQYPFDLLGKSFDFVRNLFGATGTTEEGQAEAQKAWDDWWSQSPLNMGKSVLGTLFNIVFSPINAVINELKKVFGLTTGEDEKLAFMENVNQLTEYIYNLIPSVEDIKKSLAASIGPGKIVDMLGLTNYLPMSPDVYNQQFENLLDDAKTFSQRMSTLNTIKGNLDPSDPQYITAKFYNDKALETLNDEKKRLADEYAGLITRGKEGGINATTINNTSQQIETFLFPNGGTGDGNDTVLRITVHPDMQ